MQLLKSEKKIKTATWIVGFILLVAVFVLLAPQVMAQASLGVEVGADTGLGTADLKLVITRIVRIILGFIGIIAVIIILYGGYTWMTAAGNEQKIDDAKKILVNAIIGLIIILASFAIVSYVISRLQQATISGPGAGGRDPYHINPGALGGGILQNVYPEPGATEVPRNTLIMVSYKESMDIASIIDIESDPADCADLPEEVFCGFLAEVSGDPTTLVINRSEDNAQLAADEVVVMTNDGKNFVYDPVVYLGSSDAYTNYSINLTDQINKSGGDPAFLIGGYLWSFQVSNIVDLTPPKVTGVVPVSGTAVPKNTTVQINFDEAVNVVTATGHATGDPSLPFNNILISYEDDIGNIIYMSGDATISNFFRTVEFISDIQCEIGPIPVVNSCGTVPTCFPGEEDFLVLVKAALVDVNGNTIDIFSGITDAAGNSLDGNADGFSQGQPDDNYSSNFSTTDEMDLTPPEIISPLEPEQGNESVPQNKHLKAIFNEYILSSSLNTENFVVFESACGLELPEFPDDGSCYPEGGFTTYKENISGNPAVNGGNPATKAILRTYYPYLNPLTDYNSRLTAGIKDAYQNCFNPAVGPCQPGQITPNCP